MSTTIEFISAEAARTALHVAKNVYGRTLVYTPAGGDEVTVYYINTAWKAQVSLLGETGNETFTLQIPRQTGFPATDRRPAVGDIVTITCTGESVDYYVTAVDCLGWEWDLAPVVQLSVERWKYNPEMSGTPGPYQAAEPRIRLYRDTQPSSPNEGDLYYDSTAKLYYQYRNSAWAAWGSVKRDNPPTALTDAATVTPSLADTFKFTWTIAGNRKLKVPTGGAAGDFCKIWITQGAGGNHTLDLSDFVSPTGLSLALSTAAGAVDVLTVETADGTTWRVAGLVPYAS